MSPSAELHPRERQIMDVVYLRGEATVSEVLDGLADPPSYSTVRAMLGRLEGKGFLKHRQDGIRYVYQPAHPRAEAQETALTRLMRTFFDGSPTKAMAAILDQSAADLSEEQLDELAALVESARQKGR
jgi:BlaI family transcriptional regulator, penicillinase repressor